MENMHADVRVKRGPKGRTVHLFTSRGFKRWISHDFLGNFPFRSKSERLF